MADLAFLSSFPLFRPRVSERPRSVPYACAPDLSLKVEKTLLDSEQTPAAPPSRAPPRPLPVQLDLLTYHAKCLARKREGRREAEEIYLRCIEINPSDSRAWIALARMRMQDGKEAEARQTFRKGIQAAHNNAYLLQAWGVFEERMKCFARARGLFAAAVKADPTHCASWVALGLWEKRHRKNFDFAEQCFKKGSEADPTNYYVWHAWGMLEKERRNFEAARTLFKRGVDANPRNATTYISWGGLEDATGNYSKAVRLFRKAHEVSPRNSHAYLSHAMAAQRAGHLRKARHLLSRAIFVRKGDVAPRQALAVLEWRAGNIELARRLFEKGSEVSKSYGPLWHAWACMERDVGNINRARELFQEAIWAAPKDPHCVRTWHAWAALELEQSRPVIARQYIGYGLKADPRSVPLLCQLANVEAAGGNIKGARELMEKALKEDKRDRSVWRLYEQIEKDYGTPQTAAVVFERSLVSSDVAGSRLVVSDPLPGDYKAGGMWIDADELGAGSEAILSRPRSEPSRQPQTSQHQKVSRKSTLSNESMKLNRPKQSGAASKPQGYRTTHVMSNSTVVHVRRSGPLRGSAVDNGNSNWESAQSPNSEARVENLYADGQQQS